MKSKKSSWKEICKLLINEFIIITICAFIGVAALAVTYLLSQNAMMENAKKSSSILYNEGLGPCIWEDINETQLDAYTDGLLLNTSYTVTEDGIRDIISDTYVEADGIENPMVSFYEVIVLSNYNYIVKDYGRYWHGYQIILRPLLLFFTYSDIRQINMILQLALVFIFVYILAKSEDRILIIPFFGMYIFLSPISLFSSLQFSSCFYIMMLALITLFALKEYLNNTTRNYLFLLTGIMTAYFDLLTYPFITLAVPLIAYLGSDCERLFTDENRGKDGVKDTFFYTVSWCFGYVGMWASEWIIASVLTEKNVLANAIQQIKYRSGYSQDDNTYLNTLKLNLGIINIKVFLIAIICLAAYIIICSIKKHITFNKNFFSCIGVILFVTLYPFIWYFFTQNHSSNHSYFTYRELAISVFGVLMIGVINIKKSA